MKKVEKKTVKEVAKVVKPTVCVTVEQHID